MKKSQKLLIFLLLGISYIGIYIARGNLSTAGDSLIKEGVIDKVLLGALGSVFSTVYGIGRLINGRISDSVKPYKMITAGLAITGLSNVFFAFFPPFYALAFFWICNAFGQSMLWSSMLCIISEMYDEHEAKKKSADMVATVAAGNILAILLNTYLITDFGVKYAFIVPGVITLLLSFAVLATTRSFNALSKTKTTVPFAGLFKNKEILLMSGLSALHGAMKENITLWMTVFIIETYDVDLAKTAWYVLLIPAVGLVGRMLYNIIYALCKENEHTLNVIGFAICALASGVLCLGKTKIIVSVLAMSFIYASTSLVNTSFTSVYPSRFAKEGRMAGVSGIMDFFAYFGSGISAVIFGAVIKKSGYIPMFITFIAMSVLSAAIIIFFIKNKKENKTKNGGV